MKYKFEPAIGVSRTNLTPQQRTASLFSETPIVAGKILRRGQSVTLTDAQMKTHGPHIKRLLDAGCIKMSLEPEATEHSPDAKPSSIAADLKKGAEDKLIESLGVSTPVETVPEVVPVVTENSPTLVQTEPAAPVETAPVVEPVVEAPVQVDDSATVKTGKKNKKG